jgi:hypothetical protein
VLCGSDSSCSAMGFRDICDSEQINSLVVPLDRVARRLFGALVRFLILIYRKFRCCTFY